MPNWKQELYAETNAIEETNANPAVLTIHIEGVKDFYTGTVEIYELQRELIVNAPRPVNVRLIDGSNVLSGDFSCRVDFLQLVSAFDPKPGDPEITINNVAKTLADLRPVTAANYWGLDPGDDFITIGGDKWQIVGARGLDWLDSEPARIELTLRK